MPGYNPNEPRDKNGMWTAGDAGAAIQRAASDKIKIGSNIIFKKENYGMLANKQFRGEGTVVNIDTNEFGQVFYIVRVGKKNISVSQHEIISF